MTSIEVKAHLSRFPISYPTIRNPGRLHPIIPSLSPIAVSSSGEAFRSRIRFCLESYICISVHMIQRTPSPRARMSKSEVAGSWISSIIDLWNGRSIVSIIFKIKFE